MRAVGGLHVTEIAEELPDQKLTVLFRYSTRLRMRPKRLKRFAEVEYCSVQNYLYG
jgi:hypothetical protein